MAAIGNSMMKSHNPQTLSGILFMVYTVCGNEVCRPVFMQIIEDMMMRI